MHGTTVDLLNSDQVTHNESRYHIAGPKEFVPIHRRWYGKPLCNLHINMVGYVLVVPTPYFALTDSDGSFTIKNVPPGNYTLKT